MAKNFDLTKFIIIGLALTVLVLSVADMFLGGHDGHGHGAHSEQSK